MADRRRRRRPQTSESEYSENEEQIARPKKPEQRVRESECVGVHFMFVDCLVLLFTVTCHDQICVRGSGARH